MLTHPTIEKLHALHLPAMAQAFDQQRGSTQHAELSFEDLWAFADAEGFGTWEVPAGQFAVILGLGALAGVLAAARPGRRAAKLPVLDAIAA